MRTLATIVFTLALTTVFSQTDNFVVFLENGKAGFKKEFNKQDYSVAINNLEKAVKLKPDNSEAHYFLGYVYARLNSHGDKAMIQMSLPLTIKCSEEFETVNKITPKYRGNGIENRKWRMGNRKIGRGEWEVASRWSH